jgi:hypothetical protein
MAKRARQKSIGFGSTLAPQPQTSLSALRIGENASLDRKMPIKSKR